MDSDKVQGVRSAEIPLLCEPAQALVRDLDLGASYDELFPYVVEMAKELGKQRFVQCDKMISYFEDKDCEEHYELKCLFHSIHKKLLRAVVLGTVPYDVPDAGSQNWENLYPAQGGGAYLAGMSIQGRNGAFLSCNEILELLVLLGTYRRGCEVWEEVEEERTRRPLGADDRGRFDYVDGELEVEKMPLRCALGIDNTYLPQHKQWNEGDKFRQPSAMSGKGVEAIRLLEDQLRRRLHYKDSSPDVHQISSPAYVDSSETLGIRMPPHDPGQSTMCGSSEIRKLLMACIRHMDLDVIGHSYTIVLAWKPYHVQLAETLVTVLSQSFVSTSGLNVIRPGTSRASRDSSHGMYEANKRLVMLDRPWLMENINFTLICRGTDEAYRRLAARAKKELAPPGEVERALRDIKFLEEQLRRNLDKLDAITEERRRRMEEERRRLRESDILVLLGDKILPPCDPDLSSLDDDDDDDDDNDDDDEAGGSGTIL